MQPFAQLSGKEKFIEIVRWLCVVPAAWLAAMVPVFIYRLVNPPAMAQLPGTPRPPVSDFQRIYLPHLLSIVMATAFVIVGAKIAPRYRLAVAVVLAVLWTMNEYLIHIGPHASYELRYLARIFTTAAAAIAAIAYIWYSESAKRL